VFPQRDILNILYMALALLVSLSFHEASHALVANSLGDDTARLRGRLTLNPLAHLDPVGALVMIISSIAGIGIGWAKPVPVNPYNLKRGLLAQLPNAPLVGMAIVAIAGPITNLILAAITVQLLPLTGLPQPLLLTFLRVNVILAIFNMIPIPPLDGYRVLLGLLPTGPGYTLARLEQYGPGLLMVMVFLLPQVLSNILGFFAPPVLHLIGAL
jgi:Zn-dependent protease